MIIEQQANRVRTPIYVWIIYFDSAVENGMHFADAYIYYYLWRIEPIWFDSMGIALFSIRFILFRIYANAPSASNASSNGHTVALNAIPHKNRKIKTIFFSICRGDKKQRRCAYSVPSTARLVRDWEWIKLHVVSCANDAFSRICKHEAEAPQPMTHGQSLADKRKCASGKCRTLRHDSCSEATALMCLCKLM